MNSEYNNSITRNEALHFHERFLVCGKNTADILIPRLEKEGIKADYSFASIKPVFCWLDEEIRRHQQDKGFIVLEQVMGGIPKGILR
jgi:hypothetical protein